MNVGDKVTLSKESQFYDATGEDVFNPFGVIGTVTENLQFNDGLTIIVDWGFYTEPPYVSRVTNSYNPEDLVVV